MDVDKTSFYPVLLDILTDISEAHFVAIDLELSGVPSKESWGSGKRTLQERYEIIKDAAERYQILQIGLTCVEQNVIDGKYILKPYNFDLCPIINERLDVERVFSYQADACKFLLQVGFDMSRPFVHGVPYLSRAESREAREKFGQRQDKATLSDIQIKPTEIESLAFLDRVRSEIKIWNRPSNIESRPSYLNIAPLGYETMVDGKRAAEELSRYEKRLVYQLIRAEYPELVAVGKQGFIQITHFNKEREDRIAADRKRDNEERINRQKGFRWIIEAMHGSNISSLDLKGTAKDPRTGSPIFADMDDYKAQFNRAQALLKNNPKILVGHNCFLDMVYIYRTFIGDLPDTVEEFQRKLHKLWPVVVDTKYMSTHNCGDINPVSSLEQIAQQLSQQKTPSVETDRQHRKYINVEAYHEAGFDSFLTAQVAVRLSTKLEREGAYIDDIIESRANNISDGVPKTQAADDGEPKPTPQVNGFTPSVPGCRWKRRGDPTLGPLAEDDPFKYNPRDLKQRHTNLDITIPDGMPRFGSDFWRVYGNKLRVFGTQEGVCVLDESVESPGSDDGGGVDL